MRILHLYKDYCPVLGGIENHIRVLAEAQVRRGHEVTVLVANRSWRGEVRTLNGVTVMLAGRVGTIASTPLSPALFRRLRQVDADIAHLHFPHPPGEVAQILLGRAAGTVLTYHSDIVRQRRLLRVYDPMLRHVLRRVDRILVDSPPYAVTSPYLRDVREKCTIVPLGIDVRHFERRPDAGLAELRARWGLPADGAVLVFVGRLRYYKGLEYLLRALPLVPDVRVLLVGDGPLWNHTHRLAESLGVSNRVVFTGDVGEVELPDCYAAGDLFVLPSHTRAESFGTSIVEAMAAGLPVISTEIQTGTSWVNQHGVTGLVVPPCDPAALADAIRTLLADPERRRTMGRAGLARARDHFQASTMVDEVEQVYREVLAINRETA
jgi:glycosyltransferase involved in cell wall biosynthesis